MFAQPVSRLLFYFALFLVVTGARLWCVTEYGTAMPTMDLWDAEGANLLKPWVEGRLHVSDLFRPHNEHRIVVSRLVALALVWLNRQWDAQLEMVVSALLCGVFAVAIAAGLVQLLGSEFRLLIVGAVGVWWALPFGIENILLGTSTTYFLVFFSLVAIWGIGFQRHYSPRWWAGVVALGLACLSFATGLLAAAAIVGLAALRVGRRRAVSPRDAVGAAVALLVLAIDFHFRTVVPYHAADRSHSALAFATAFGKCVAWPFSSYPMLAVVLYLPTLALLAWCFFRRHTLSARSLAAADGVFVTSMWATLQAAAVAYARGGAEAALPASRHMDYLACGAVMNLLAAAWLVMQTPPQSRVRRAGVMLVSYFAVALLIGAGAVGWSETAMRSRRAAVVLPIEESVRGYVATGDRSFLEGDPPPPIPYPVPARLAELLDDRAIRSILPAIIRAPVRLEPESPTSGFTLSGIPEAVLNPDFERTWSSYTPAGTDVANVTRSAPFTTAFPCLRFELIGRLGRRMSLNVRDEPTGSQRRLSPKRAQADGWRVALVEAPGATLRVVARDENLDSWFAFREPRELGRLSYYAESLAGSGSTVFWCGIVLALAAPLLGLERKETATHGSARNRASAGECAV